jgi:hypothetical protein
LPPALGPRQYALRRRGLRQNRQIAFATDASIKAMERILANKVKGKGIPALNVRAFFSVINATYVALNEGTTSPSGDLVDNTYQYILDFAKELSEFSKAVV